MSIPAVTLTAIERFNKECVALGKDKFVPHVLQQVHDDNSLLFKLLEKCSAGFSPECGSAYLIGATTVYFLLKAQQESDEALRQLHKN